MLLRHLSIFRAPLSRYYHVLFLVRRLLFVLVPLILFSGPSLQLICLISVQLAYFMVTCKLMGMPHDQRKHRFLEFFNEYVILLLYYHMLYFTDFAIN